MSKFKFADDTYPLIGIAYKVFNDLGYGYQEKYYQRAFARELDEVGFKYGRELYFPITYQGKIIGKYFMDFVVKEKVVIELKIANNFYLKHTKQILAYLKAKNYPVGLLIFFTKDGVKFRRFINTPK